MTESRERIFLAFFISLLLHLVGIGAFFILSIYSKNLESFFHLTPHSNSSMTQSDQGPDKRIIEFMPSPKAQPLDKPNDKARYLSKFNQKVDRETIRKSRQSGVTNPSSSHARQAEQAKLAELSSSLSSLSPFQRIKSPTQTSESSENGSPEIDDTEALEGAQTLLNTQQSKHYSFFSRISEVLSPIWKSHVWNQLQTHSIPSGTYQSLALITLDSDGRVLDVEFLKKSGMDPFETAIVLAWKQAAQFQNPPRELIDPDGKARIKFSFTVELDASTGEIQLGRPKRVN